MTTTKELGIERRLKVPGAGLHYEVSGTGPAAAPRVVVGVGEESGGQLAHDAGLARAGRLGTPAVTFPGGHSGYFTRPRAFAAKLREVLGAG